MLVARHFRRRLLIFSVSTLGFFICSFSAVLALDFTGLVVSVLDGDTLEAASPPVEKLYTLLIWDFGLMVLILRQWNHFPPDKNCQLSFQLSLP